MKTSSRRLKPDSCQTHQQNTYRLTPDFRQTNTLPDPIIDVYISWHQSRHRQNLMSIFSA
jgi:hypothetical protein